VPTISPLKIKVDLGTTDQEIPNRLGKQPAAAFPAICLGKTMQVKEGTLFFANGVFMEEES
jgi:hypothetical protein